MFVKMWEVHVGHLYFVLNHLFTQQLLQSCVCTMQKTAMSVTIIITPTLVSDEDYDSVFKIVGQFDVFSLPHY